MSNITITGSQSNALFGQTDVSKIFLGSNLTEGDNYINNSSYDPITLPAGTVLGRIGSTGVLVPTQSDANDGSQNVLGVLMQDLVIAGGGSVTALVCVSGLVAAEKLVFVKPGDGLDKAVSNRRYRDKIQGETVGIKLVFSKEMTRPDNQ